MRARATHRCAQCAQYVRSIRSTCVARTQHAYAQLCYACAQVRTHVRTHSAYAYYVRARTCLARAYSENLIFAIFTRKFWRAPNVLFFCLVTQQIPKQLRAFEVERKQLLTLVCGGRGGRRAWKQLKSLVRTNTSLSNQKLTVILVSQGGQIKNSFLTCDSGLSSFWKVPCQQPGGDRNGGKGGSKCGPRGEEFLRCRNC